MHESPRFWVLRPYDLTSEHDEAVCVYMWTRSYLDGAGFAFRKLGPRRERNPLDEKAEWDALAPIFLRCLREQQTVLAVDAEDPDRTVYGFACWDPDEPERVHYAAVKRKADKAGVARDILEDLLGSRLDSPRTEATFEPADLRRKGRSYARDWKWSQDAMVELMKDLARPAT